MKRIFHPSLFAALVLGASTSGLFAQTPNPGPQGPPDGHRGPPPSPLFRALDANHDGIISADEIANAPAALKALADSSGQITRASLRPVRREDDRRDDRQPGREDDRRDDRRRHDDRQGDDRRDDNRRPHPDASREPGPDHENGRHHGPPPPPDGEDSPVASPDGQDGPPPLAHRRPEDRRGGPRPAGERDQQRLQDASPAALPGASPSPDQDRPRRRPPHDVLFDALDANHDGVISADEIANAPAALKKADTNGDGQIDRQELRPPPPPPGQND